MSTLLILAVAALAIPTIATMSGGPAQGHARELSVVVSVVLLVVFVASVPFSLGHGRQAAGATETPDEQELAWPLSVALGALLISGIGAALVSDWFVDALKPAAAALGMSETFAGLVVVAIAGNAVENVVGIRAMLADKGDLAISLILNSSLQVALALTPVLVIVSLFVGTATLTLVVSPLLVAAMALTTLLAAFVVIDGESTWLEGVALVGLYAIIAASVWWGPTIGG
jgi:Ca2+:H+ antiporter